MSVSVYLANTLLFVHRLVYVEKFSQFTRLLEANMFPVQQTCQKQGDGYGCAYLIMQSTRSYIYPVIVMYYYKYYCIVGIALSMTELGCNLQKLAKGTQLVKGALPERSKLDCVPLRWR